MIDIVSGDDLNRLRAKLKVTERDWEAALRVIAFNEQFCDTPYFANYHPAYRDRNGTAKPAGGHLVKVRAAGRDDADDRPPRQRNQCIWLHHFFGWQSCLLGTYFVDEDGLCRRLVIDIDGHNEDQHPEDSRDQLQKVLDGIGASYLLGRSKGGHGYHVEMVAQPLPAWALRAFGVALVRVAGLPRETEVFPKQSGLVATGSQTWRMGSRAWFEATKGGSMYLDREGLQPIPFHTWPDLLRGVTPLTEERLFDLAIRLAEYGQTIGVEAFPAATNAAPREGSDAAVRDGDGPAWNFAEMERFLVERGFAFEAKGPTTGWTHRFELARCPNEGNHSRRDDPTGACVFLDESSGRVGFRCHHSHCADIRWRDARRLIDPTRSYRLATSGGLITFIDAGSAAGTSSVVPGTSTENRGIATMSTAPAPDGHRSVPQGPANAPLQQRRQPPPDAKDQDEDDKWVPDLNASHVGKHIDGAIKRGRDRANGIEAPVPIEFAALRDVEGGGFFPGLHFIVGNTGSGKTQLGMQLLLHAALKGVPCAFIGLELGHLDLVWRILGLMAKKKWSPLFLGHDLPGLEDVERGCAKDLKSLPIHLEVAGSKGWGSKRLAKLAKAMRARYPAPTNPTPQAPRRPVLLVLDFLQLVGDIETDVRARIAQAAYAARHAARDLDVAMLVISSTSRENAKILGGGNVNNEQPLGEGTPTRLVGLGKEAGEIEYSADSVLVLGRDAKQVAPASVVPPPPTNVWQTGKGRKAPVLIQLAPAGAHLPPTLTKMWLAAAKVRAGSPAWIPLDFNGGWFTEPPATTGPGVIA